MDFLDYGLETSVAAGVVYMLKAHLVSFKIILRVHMFLLKLNLLVKPSFLLGISSLFYGLLINSCIFQSTCSWIWIALDNLRFSRPKRDPSVLRSMEHEVKGSIFIILKNAFPSLVAMKIPWRFRSYYKRKMQARGDGNEMPFLPFFPQLSQKSGNLDKN